MAFNETLHNRDRGRFAPKHGAAPEFSLAGQLHVQNARRVLVLDIRQQVEASAILYRADSTVRNEDAMLAAEYRLQEAIIDRDKMDVETLGTLTDALRIIEAANAAQSPGMPDAPISVPDLAQRFGETATRRAGERMTALTRLALQRPELRELHITARTTPETREGVIHSLAEKLHGGFRLADLMFDARAVGGETLTRHARRKAVDALFDDESGFVEDFRATHFTGHEHTIAAERRAALGNARHAPYFDMWG